MVHRQGFAPCMIGILGYYYDYPLHYTHKVDNWLSADSSILPRATTILEPIYKKPHFSVYLFSPLCTKQRKSTLNHSLSCDHCHRKEYSYDMPLTRAI